MHNVRWWRAKPKSISSVYVWANTHTHAGWLDISISFRALSHSTSPRGEKKNKNGGIFDTMKHCNGKRPSGRFPIGPAIYRDVTHPPPPFNISSWSHQHVPSRLKTAGACHPCLWWLLSRQQRRRRLRQPVIQFISPGSFGCSRWGTSRCKWTWGWFLWCYWARPAYSYWGPT